MKRKKIGGMHSHDEQCSKIPDQINFIMGYIVLYQLYGVQLEPCYKDICA